MKTVVRCAGPRRVPLVMLMSVLSALLVWADRALAQPGTATEVYQTCRDRHRASAPAAEQRPAWVREQRAGGRTQSPPWLQQQQADIQDCLRSEAAQLSARRAPAAGPPAPGRLAAKS